MVDMCLSPPVRSPRSQLAAEQPLTGEYWKPPKKKKKDTPCRKKKEKLQQHGRRGTIMIKPNPIPTGWTTQKLQNHSTKGVFPLYWRFWAPMSGFSARGTGIWTRNPQGIWFWRSAGFGCRISIGWGWGVDRNSPFGGHKQNLVYTMTQEKGAVTPQETGPDLAVVLGGLLWSHESAEGPPIVGMGSLEQHFWEKPSWGLPLPYLRACRHQIWVSSGQTTNRGVVQPHLSTDNQIQALLSQAYHGKTQFFPPPVPHIRRLAQTS